MLPNQPALKEDNSETLEEYPVVKEYDTPSSEDEFPEGGMVAWATVVGS